ncbi:hypothetical protein SAMN04488591_0625 [Microbacterium azadirachtae]|uniref:Uncharacterized protein n=1 Tax=Microbacterium azadirachtae TaxID=582680 RepID=A0A1I6G158_9MICO|nr:hypothetical protein [Microbacterium azadirachtae]SFR35953.1 hypothetical protein SAMN04488591_0625 [Microbacterium azadirachtae]
MTESTRSVAVAGAHRSIRVLADGEGPFPGELVSRGATVAVRTPVARLRGWAGWAHAGAEHVAAPLDLALGADGQDALLPWCVRTVDAHLVRGGEVPSVSRGEAVTLAVSMLRGVVELAPERGGAGDPGEEAHGRWWLTDDGRPVFVIPPAADATGETVCVAAQHQLRALEGRVDDRALRRLLLRLADALHDPRRLRAEAARWEQELLEIAAPRPLYVSGSVDESRSLEVPRREQAPRAPSPRRRDLRSGDAMPRRRSDGFSHGVRRGMGPLRQSLAGLRETAVARRAATFLSRFARSAPSRPRVPRPRVPRPTAHPPRRRWVGPTAVAVAAAVVIVLGGALWPVDRTSSADAADHTPRPRPSSASAPSPGTESPAASPTAQPTPAPSDAPRPPGPSAQQDPRAAAEELLSAARRCRVTPVPECDALWEGEAAAAEEVRDQDGQPALIEDYGDLAALRSGAGEDAQLVVIIRRNAEWRIRDVYDIADPPSEGAGTP